MKTIITNPKFLKILDERTNYFLTLLKLYKDEIKSSITMIECPTIYTGYFEVKMIYIYYDSGNDEVFYTDKII